MVFIDTNMMLVCLFLPITINKSADYMTHDTSPAINNALKKSWTAGFLLPPKVQILQHSMLTVEISS